MKKFTALIITFLLLISCFSLTAFATEEFYDEDFDCTTTLDPEVTVTFSKDYKTLYFGEEEYVRFSGENIYNSAAALMENKIKLTSAQKAEVKEIILNANEEGSLINAQIDYTDGAYTTCDYLKAEYVSEYNELLTSKTVQHEVDFLYPEGNTVVVSGDKLSGETVTLDDIDYNDDYFDVVAYSKDKKLTVVLGMLIIYKDEYYYTSYSELGSDYYNYYLYEDSSVTAHKITDTDTVAALDEALNRSYTSDYGFFFDDNFTKTVADVLIIIIFALLPFAALVTFTVLPIRSKGIYRKMCVTITALSAAELAIFIIVTLIVT